MLLEPAPPVMELLAPVAVGRGDIARRTTPEEPAADEGAKPLPLPISRCCVGLCGREDIPPAPRCTNGDAPPPPAAEPYRPSVEAIGCGAGLFGRLDLDVAVWP